MNERRILYLLIALLLGQLVLIATQVAGERPEESLLERSLLRALAPVAHGISSVTKSVGSAGERLETRASLTEENERMAAELEALRLEVFRLRNIERLVDRLAQAVEYSPPRGFDVQVADVVYADASTRLGTLLLFIGDLPVRKDQPVVAPDGLVGRVILVAGPYAKVQLLSDRSATVGAMIERTRRQGIIRSSLEGDLTLDYVPLQDDVQVGDRVQTSGIDGVYPAGIPIGRVVSVEPGGELFHDVHVQSSVDLGRLDQVYLLDAEPVPEEMQENSR